MFSKYLYSRSYRKATKRMADPGRWARRAGVRKDGHVIRPLPIQGGQRPEPFRVLRVEVLP
jgi:hypothetical protein